MTDDSDLLAALAVIQARGAIGERSLKDAVSHADRFVELIPLGGRSLVDLGSGGGLPALVIAWRRPDVDVTMVERRATRADLLRRAVTSLRLEARATVINSEVDTVGKSEHRRFDVVTARSFADPITTARSIEMLLADGGVALVSEPPDDRTPAWTSALFGRNLADDGVYQGIRRLLRP